MSEAWTAQVITCPTHHIPQVTHQLLPLLHMLEAQEERFNISRYHGQNPHLTLRTLHNQGYLVHELSQLVEQGPAWDVEPQPYTAPLEERRGYELATRLYLALDTILRDHLTDIVLTDDVQLHMFHGLRNLLTLEEPLDEAMFWHRLSASKRHEARLTNDIPDDPTHDG